MVSLFTVIIHNNARFNIACSFKRSHRVIQCRNFIAFCQTTKLFLVKCWPILHSFGDTETHQLLENTLQQHTIPVSWNSLYNNITYLLHIYYSKKV